jgi:hypothetical protein
VGIRGDQPVLGHLFPLFDPRQLHGIDLNVRPTPRAFKVRGPILNRLDNIVVVDPQSRPRRYREPRRFSPSIDPTTPSIVRATATFPTHSSLSLFEAVQRPPTDGVFTGIASVPVPVCDSPTAFFLSVSPSEGHRELTSRYDWALSNERRPGLPRFSTDACSWRCLLKHRDNALTGEKRRHSLA